MKNILVVITLACATLFLTQCKKEIVEQQGGGGSGEMIEVSLNVDNSGGSKTEISTSGIVSWEIGDVLHVVGEADGYLGDISAQNTGASAYFIGSIAKPTATQDLHFYYTGSQEFTLTSNTYFTYNISQQTGKLADIAEHLHLMHGEINDVTAGTTNLGTITMTSMMSIVKLQFGMAAETKETLGDKVMCTGGFSAIKFNVKSGSFDSEGRVRYRKNIYLDNVTTAVDGIYYMAVTPGAQTLEFSQGIMGKSLECPDGGFAANTFYSNVKSVELGELPYLPAIFTINNGSDGEQWTEDDTQVKFSKGNLQYLGNEDGTGTWRFATNQYDFIGYADNSLDAPTRGNVADVSNYAFLNYGSGYDETLENPSQTEQTGIANDKKSARDLFGWGCTGFVDTRDNNSGNQKHFMPYSTYDKVNTDNQHLQCFYGPDYAAKPRNSLSVEHKSDWGCIETLPGNSAVKKIWKTMSSDEWGWLMGPSKKDAVAGTDCRKSSTLECKNGVKVENARFAFVKVNDVNGVFIFPDNFSWPDDVDKRIIRTHVNYTSSTPSTGNIWTAVASFDVVEFGKLEKAGVVFLPASGCRLGKYLINLQQQYCIYNSSTPSGSDVKNRFTLKSGCVISGVTHLNNNGTFSQYACSVRLVNEAQK